MEINPVINSSTIMSKVDISSRKDIEVILSTFYDKLLADPSTSSIFQEIDMDHHLPIIVDFWEMILLDGMNYKGNPFEKHRGLNLNSQHFSTWLAHFENTINQNYHGPKADLALQRAKSIAFIFSSKLGLTIS